MKTASDSNHHAIASALLAEFEQELGTTRKFLERVPADLLNWRPHEKSMSAGELALHIAETPGLVLQITIPDQSEVPDFSQGRPQPASHQQVLDKLEASAAFLRETLPTIDDARMQATLNIVQNGKTLLSLPRAAFLRSIMLNHWYHHRGQLGVYLRLMGATVPSSYGPSGDEMPDFAK